MAYREKAKRAPVRFELRPAPGYWAAAGLMTLLSVSVAGLIVVVAMRHGAPPLGVLLRGGAVVAVATIFWLGTAGYRVRGAIVVDDDHVTLVDSQGRALWRLAVPELGVEVAYGAVILRKPGQVRRVSTRLFRSSVDVDDFTQALMVRALGESAEELLHGVFSELFAGAKARGGEAQGEAPANAAGAKLDAERDAELDARLDRELEKLD